MKTDAKVVLQILKEEFGITTFAELCKAIDKMEKIDIAPFVRRVQEER